MIDQLCSVERDRVTAAEICLDELLTIMDRHGIAPRDPLYQAVRLVSGELDARLSAADGPYKRRERLIRIRTALTNVMPMTDDDLAESAAEPSDEVREAVEDAETARENIRKAAEQLALEVREATIKECAERADYHSYEAAQAIRALSTTQEQKTSEQNSIPSFPYVGTGGDRKP
jgi:hypothetical protein